MIAKAVHGYRPAGLIAYLFGPGKHEEHRNPRVVASWDGAPWLHQPEKLTAINANGAVVEADEFNFDLGPLTRTMQELAEQAGLPTANPPAITPEWEVHVRNGTVPRNAPDWVKYYKYSEKAQAVVLRQGYVWHCPVRLHELDPTLTDKQWQHIAERLMKATGIHQQAVRWIAVRHADDHIHLMATLVSEQTGKRVYPFQDYPKLRDECLKLEKEFGLVPTPGIDKTAAPTPTRQEKGKAERNRWATTSREELRRIVAQCASSVNDGEAFLRELRREGLNPRTSRGADGEIRGYSVALPSDTTAAGKPVLFSGGKLASDLTWPKLVARWASVPSTEPVARTEDGRVSPADRRAVLEHAAAVVDRAAAQVRDGAGDVDGVAHAVGEVLAVLSRGREGHTPGLLTEISERYDRAARTPHRVVPETPGTEARELRRASRRIAAAGALSGRGNEKFAAVALMLALAGLIAEIAEWKQSRGLPHQAAAARTAAGALSGVDQGGGAGRRPAGARPVTPPAAGGLRRERPVARRHVAGTTESSRRGRRPG